MLHAVIMAGGSGTRFWPASTKAQPKQLLPLAGERTMIQATVARLGEMIPPERVMIVTNERLVAPIAAQLPELPASSILGEPARRDTAPCIGLAAIQIGQADPDAIMVVMPADHVIAPDEKFQQAIQLATELVDECPQRIVTFGIQPTYPAEIFGYIQRSTEQIVRPVRDRAEPVSSLAPESSRATSDPHSATSDPHSATSDPHSATSDPRSATSDPRNSGDQCDVYRVNSFREKPDQVNAEAYVASGDYYWNSGIFVWKAAHIMNELAAHEAAMFAHLQLIADAADTDEYQEVLRREFTAIDSKSIDYAVMERATDVVVIEAPFEWDDVGSWRSLARLRGADNDNNTIVAKQHVGVQTSGSIIAADDDHLIATVGVRDLIIVQVDNVTLVANKNDEESVREIVQQLQDRGLDEYL